MILGCQLAPMKDRTSLMKSIALKISSLLLLIVALSAPVLAQRGTLIGKVVDGKTGETLPGTAVTVEGSTIGTITDFDGAFSMALEPGTYKITIKYFGFKTKSITEVSVRKNDETSLTVSMEESESTSLAEVVVTGTAARENVNALLLQQKNIGSVSDGISSESIRRTPDRNTGDVLKRVSGASIQDNKFAIVRGLNDRYNAAYINGAPLPSTESDRKAFSFDIFPANLLDNLVIVKTASPELPGEFAGGVIQINTKSIPSKNFNQLSISSSYNTLTTFQTRLDYQGGKWDWLGIDDGARSMPTFIPTTSEMFNMSNEERAGIAKQLKNDWAMQKGVFLPSLSFQYSGGLVKKSEAGKEFGAIYALTYQSNNSFNTTHRQTWQNSIGEVGMSQMESDLFDENHVVNTLAGVLANLSYKFSPNHQIGLKNMYSINAQDRVLSRYGTRSPLDAPNEVMKFNAFWFTSNQIVTSQLNGDHYFTESKLKWKWLAGLSNIHRVVPNLRNTLYYGNTDVADTAWRAGITFASVGPDYSGSRFYGDNNETMSSIESDVEKALDFEDIGLRNQVKIGMGAQFRDRAYTARQFGHTTYGSVGGSFTFDYALLNLPQDQIFRSENMGLINPTTGGFLLREGTKNSDSYEAQSYLNFAFLQVDSRYMEKSRFVWGVRAELFHQALNALRDNGDDITVNTQKLDILPSVNYVYSINDQQNFRLSYSKTLNRPEFRELAPFSFYDFTTRYVVTGNDSLKRASIQNFDVRYEIYPGRGQVFSVSGFYKHFTNPIEQATRQDVVTEYSYMNVASAEDYGVELEGRLLLASLFGGEEKDFFKNTTIFANYAFIRSRVDVSRLVGVQDSLRPLQGQSPYVFNAGIQYLNHESGWGASASFNRVGQRIFIVGTVVEPDIWEQGRSVLDLQVSKSFADDKWEIRLTARDLLAQDLIFFNDISGNRRFDEGQDDEMWRTNFGPTVQLGLNYKF